VIQVSVRDLIHCPECGTNWVSSAIPQEYKENHSFPYFYSRIVGCYDIVKDRTEYYQCPDCNTTFPRFGPDVKTYEVDETEYATYT
jgi:DNA-directed RNA polymerase subunit RPC12/RpoP